VSAPRRASRLLGVLGLVIASIVAAETAWHTPFTGSWHGQGRFMGNDATYDLVITPVLDSKFVQFSVRYAWRDSAGKDLSFTGQGTYPAQAKPSMRGAWFDSEGHHFSSTAFLENERALIVHWGDGELKGRTEYRVLDSGELQVGDSFERDGKWQKFSDARLKKAPSGG